MSSFEYVMVIVSIILGLGITTLLRGAVNAVRVETETTPGLLHSLWVLALLLQHVALWSLRWSGERREEWPAGVLLFFLLLPILWYAQAELLFPRAGRKVDLTEYLLDNRRPFFGLACLGFISAGIGPFVFYDGVDPFTGVAAQALGQSLFYALLASVSLILALSRNKRLHLTVAWLWLLFIIMGLFTNPLTVG